jgi:hypothetical protein
MKINFWNCKYHDAEEVQLDEDDFGWIYYCTHPDGKYCNLNNKWGDDEDNCELLDRKIIDNQKLVY